MFEIRVEKTIACAHQLFGYNGPCEKLHGHNYRVEVALRGTELDEFGMLEDFTVVKLAFNAILDELDHEYLNDLPAFKGLSPSAENIAAYVYREMKSRGKFQRGKVHQVSVWETPTQVAVYSED